MSGSHLILTNVYETKHTVPESEAGGVGQQVVGAFSGRGEWSGSGGLSKVLS